DTNNTNSLDGARSTITNIVFGNLALVVGMLAIWQAYRTYQTSILEHFTRTNPTPESKGATETTYPDSWRLHKGEQTSNAGGPGVSVGLPLQDTTELLRSHVGLWVKWAGQQVTHS
ncbi:hypothetical protein MMC29_007792, partial [Sticta canariensis]|nr:hypothetical protein [Sticta canariensis]